MTTRACALPFSFECTRRTLRLLTQEKPIDKFVFADFVLDQMMRKFVTTRTPRSPLFPFVSSTELMESICCSPSRSANTEGFRSNLIARSCQQVPSSSAPGVSAIALALAAHHMQT